ncbi:MAG: permease, partial [Candidatus Saganbacteria bacterium]|nr:permease [Candidatus Saganbacteria bacterium]
VFAFTQKGIATGTALAFMMAIAGLSFPEAVILKSVMKLRLLAVFFTIVALGIMAIGYLFNFLF